jgi:hypothetical protein
MSLIAMVMLALALPQGPATAAAGATPEATVRSAYDAFNTRDADAFVRHMSDDIRWMSVTGETVKVETSGREPLRAYLTRYFRGMPTVQSRIESLMAAGPYVTVHERVTWQSAKGERTQSALAVYQVTDGRITAVWYHDVMK